MSKTSRSEEHDAFDADDAAEALEAEVAESGDRDREIAELNEKYLRTLADFQNFKRRSIENEERERPRASPRLPAISCPCSTSSISRSPPRATRSACATA